LETVLGRLDDVNVSHIVRVCSKDNAHLDKAVMRLLQCSNICEYTTKTAKGRHWRPSLFYRFF